MKRRFVIGTAGHIDHGKSTLVRALTGIDTDRLAEEKRRGITIDLGFAHFELPDGTVAAMVDVPGHEDFIRNMVAGASGIDVGLLVVAADEGVMPQTREHATILEMLGVDRMIVALTKIDAVDDAWLELVRDDVAGWLATTAWPAAPVVPVSARSGAGLESLTDRLTDATPPVVGEEHGGPFRMPADRAFSVHGTGTVVTGTIREGAVGVGDVVTLLPQAREARVRAIETHGVPVESVGAGTRAALALAGIEREACGRGTWVTKGAWPTTKRVTVLLRLAQDAEWTLRQRQRVRVHAGTAEVMARVRLFDASELVPGRETLAQLRLEAPIVARCADRLVVRSYSPVTTIGGAIVLEPSASPRRRLRPGDHELLQSLARAADDCGLRLLEAAGADGIAPDDLVFRLPPAAPFDPAQAVLAGGRMMAPDLVRGGVERLIRAVQDWHAARPLRPGLEISEARRLVGAGADAAMEAAIAGGRLIRRDGCLAVPGFEVRPTREQAAAMERLEGALREAGLAGLTHGDLRQGTDPSPDDADLLALLEAAGTVQPFPPDRLLHSAALEAARSMLEAEFAGRTDLQPADFRGLFDLPRRHLIPLLELFDRRGWTRREGDRRSVAAVGASRVEIRAG